ncbi:MAG TPA: acyl-CoA dehydrogenase family protein [Chloroflexota bacterium]|nr:acyl-CoA dehydrogenase family protein [Chloroflexota bacterium]
MVDFALSEPQEMLRRTLREFMQREYPPTAVRAAETTERGYDLAIYQRLNDLGVLGLGLPEEVGGAGGSWVDLAVFYEEAGRALLASPHLSSVVLGGGLLARHGSAAQQQAWLADLARGARVLAVGWPLEGGEAGPSGIEARRDGDGYVLRGEVAHVAGYVGADGVLLVAEMADTGGRQGLFLAAPDTPGLTGTRQPLMSGEPLARLRLDDARLDAAAAVGEALAPAALWGPLLDGAKVALAAYALGAASAAVDMGVAYAKDRQQFGRPIGSFQAVQHRLANLQILVEQARLLTYHAAWLLDQGADARRAAAMAKLRASIAVREAATGNILVHGGYGFMLEADPQLYYRRAKLLELALGNPDAERALLAREHQPLVAAQ